MSDAMRVAPSATKLALFVLVTLLAFGLLATTIANVRWGPKASYAALFTDATGVIAGDDVRIAGVRVGEVTDVRLAGTGPAERNLARVEFTVDRSLALTKGTTALIRYRNLVGQRFLALTQSQAEPGRLPIGATLDTEHTQPSLDLTVLFNGFKPLFAALDPDDVNTLAFEIITVLQGEGGTVEHLLASTASLTQTLAERDQVIGRTIDNLNAVLGTVDERSGQLDQLLVQLQRFVSGLSADREAIGASLASIGDLADSTAGLLEQARPPLKTDIAELGALATTLDENQAAVRSFLRTWPGKVETITRTATYGSWFNFYLCEFSGTVVLPAGQQVPIPPQQVSTARCAP